MKAEQFSNNQLSNIAKCDTAAVLTYVHQRSGKSVSAPALLGSVIHEAMKVWWGGGTRKEALRALKPYREWADENVDASDRFQARLSWENVRLSMLYYFRQNAVEDLPFIVEPDRLEVAFEVFLSKSGDISLIGIIDSGPNRDRKSRKFSTTDHKSTGNIDAPWFAARFEMDSQSTGYLWATREMFIEPIMGMYINAIQVAKLPYLDEPNRKCSVHKMPYHECRWEHQKSTLKFLDRSNEEMKTWRWDALELARKFLEMREEWKDLDDLPKVPQQGKFNGSCAICDFRNFCYAGRPVDRIDVMTSVREARMEWV